jgi:hypothetical protein
MGTFAGVRRDSWELALLNPVSRPDATAPAYRGTPAGRRRQVQYVEIAA